MYQRIAKVHANTTQLMVIGLKFGLSGHPMDRAQKLKMPSPVELLPVDDVCNTAGEHRISRRDNVECLAKEDDLTVGLCLLKTLSAGDLSGCDVSQMNIGQKRNTHKHDLRSRSTPEAVRGEY